MALSFDSIYARLPVALQNLSISVYGNRIQRRRYGAGYCFIEEDVRARRALKEEALKDTQRKRLRRFLEVAVGSPFWRQRFRLYGVDVGATDPFRELAKLPILTKAEVKGAVAEIRHPEFSRGNVLTVRTSGSTGSSLQFWKTSAAEHEQWAVWWRYRAALGITRETWCGYFGGRAIVPRVQLKPPFWRWNYPGRQLMFSVYHLCPSTVRFYWDRLRKSPVAWLHGYPSALSLLAGLMLEQGLKPLAKLRVITIGAEGLLGHQRTLMEEAFQVPVFQHYGLAEGVANISECEEGVLHVDEDFAFSELIPLRDGSEECMLIGTNWSNLAFPLIRYDTGDLVTPGRRNCNCERCGRVVLRIDGRQEDYIVLPSGEKIGRVSLAFTEVNEIREAQVYQRRCGGIVLRIVKGRYYDAKGTEQRLVKALRKRLGHEIPLEVEYLSEVPKTSSGKLRLVVSDMQGGRINSPT